MASDLAFAMRGVGTAVGNNFALRDVSFELDKGSTVGANGAGKTTAIRCLLGMRPIEIGEIELLGNPVPGPVSLRQDVGVVLDHAFLVGDWRLAEVERTLRPFYDRWDSVRYHELLDEFGLDLRAKVKDLSHGMSMKLMIAVALSHQARLLVAVYEAGNESSAVRLQLLGNRGMMRGVLEVPVKARALQGFRDRRPVRTRCFPAHPASAFPPGGGPVASCGTRTLPGWRQAVESPARTTKRGLGVREPSHLRLPLPDAGCVKIWSRRAPNRIGGGRQL